MGENPLSDAGWLAEFGDPSDLQAVGAVIAAWNTCEHSLLSLMHIVMKTDWKTTCRIFNNVGNQTRLDLVLGEAASKLTKEEQLALAAFAKHFSICRENRNIIAHSRMAPNNFIGGVTLFKMSSNPSMDENYFTVTTTVMHEVAKAIKNTSDFGRKIYLVVRI